MATVPPPAILRERFDALVANGLNHAARVAAMALVEPLNPVHEAAAGNMVVVDARTPPMPHSDDYLSVFFEGTPADSWRDADFAACVKALRHEAWRGAEHDVTFPAFPDSLRSKLCESLLALGARTVCHREACPIWEAPASLYDGTWLQAHGGDAAAAAAALGALTCDYPLWSTSLGLPADLVFDTLRPADAPVLNAHWKYAHGAFTEHRLRETIRLYPTACVRRRRPAADSDAAGVGVAAGASAPAADASFSASDSDLVAWMVHRSDGSLGVLHVLPSHRGRGLAKAVTKALIASVAVYRQRLISEARAAEASGAAPAGAAARTAHIASFWRPHCHILKGNVESERVFSGMGFAPIQEVSWYMSTHDAPRFRLRPIAPGDDREWSDLLTLVNTSYRQDDAFFVDQQRTDMDNLRTMARSGVFYVGYRLAVDAAVAAAWPDEVPRLPSTTATAAAGAEAVGAAAVGGAGACGVAGVDALAAYRAATLTGLDRPVTFPVDVRNSAAVPAGCCAETCAPAADESRELLCCVYVQVEGGTGEGSRAAPAAAPAEASGGHASEAPAAGAAAVVSSAPAAAAATAVADANGPSHGDTGGLVVAHFGMLTIAPSLKKRGVAQRVLNFVHATARQTYKCDAAECFVVSVKPWLLAFYREPHNGYEAVGREEWPAANEHQLKMPCFFHRCRKALA